MTPAEARVKEELEARREALAEIVSRRPEESLRELLQQVDDALGRAKSDVWGLCTICHATIEAGRLDADPLVSICLECLSPDERRELERDLESAALVQRSLLPPRELVDDEWEVAWRWEPLGAVSGDFVDLRRPERGGAGPLHLLLGDVAGKGVAASLLQSHVHALFRVLATPETDLGDLVARANRLFCEATASAHYATLVTLRLQPGGLVEMANAGHPRPLLADARGVRPVEGAGLPLGMFCESAYAARTLCLAPGDTLLVYTDGWTEAATEAGEYAIGRAAAALAANARRPLPDLLGACIADMAAFLDGVPRPDDVTLLAVRRKAPGA